MMELFLTLLAMASVGALGFAFYTLKYKGPAMPTRAEGEAAWAQKLLDNAAAERKMLQEIEDDQTNLTVVS